MGLIDSIVGFLSSIFLGFALISAAIAIIDQFVEGNISLLFLNLIGLMIGFFLQVARVLNFFPYLTGDFSEIPRFFENLILFFLIAGGLFFDFTAEFFVTILFLPIDLFFGAVQSFHNSLPEPIPVINEILNGSFLVLTEPIIIEGITLFEGSIQITPSAGNLINDLRNIVRDIIGVFLNLSRNFFLESFGVQIETAGIDFMLRILSIERGLSPTLEALGTGLGATIATNTALAGKQLFFSEAQLLKEIQEFKNFDLLIEQRTIEREARLLAEAERIRKEKEAIEEFEFLKGLKG